jgi:ubiquitin-conjugating enzyme E2 variant
VSRQGEKRSSVRPPDDPFATEPYTPKELRFHVLGATVNGALTVAGLAWLVARVAAQPQAWPWVVGGVLLGIYLADLVSGLLHWAFDTWFDADIGFIRRMVLQVREHHIHPQRIFDISFLHDAGTLSWIALLLTAPIYAGALLAAPNGVALFFVATVVVFDPLLVFMLVFHKCGHRPRNPRFVRWLQASGILLSARHHMQHHAGNHDFNYCLINGWADRTLGRLGLFRGLERLIERTTGARPQRDDHEWMRRFGRGQRIT